MPLYEYECTKCQHRFEKIQGFADSPVKECPDCGGVVARVLHPTAVIFKGGGFYTTDNKGKAQ